MSNSLYRMRYGSLAESAIEFLEIRRGVFILMTKLYQEPGKSTQAKIQLFYPDVRLKMAELLDVFVYSTVLDFTG